MLSNFLLLFVFIVKREQNNFEGGRWVIEVINVSARVKIEKFN